MSILKMENLKKSFGKTEVLKDISFEMNEGEVIAILGSSGSGKTTLLRCVNFLEKADKGKIYVNDNLIYDASTASKLTPKQARQNQLNFGLVFQSFNLFPQYNVFENVTLAPKLLAKEEKNTKKYEEIDKKAYDILEKVGLSEKINNYPCELSGGQQQRVSIARALMLDPKVLFFDEPTSALDPELTGEILKVIKSLAAKNTTMIIVTHEIEFAKNVADRIVFMADGYIVEEGAARDIVDNPQNERTKAFLKGFKI